MKLNETQIEILKGIQGKLMRGDQNTIAKKKGFSNDYVSMVLNPESDYYNEEIVTEAVRIITEREQNNKKLLESIKEQPESLKQSV